MIISQHKHNITQKQQEIDQLTKELPRVDDKLKALQKEVHENEENQAKLDQLHARYPWLKGGKGKRWSEQMTAIMFCFMLVMMCKLGWTKTQACRVVSMTGHAYPILWQRFNFWWTTGKMMNIDQDMTQNNHENDQQT